MKDHVDNTETDETEVSYWEFLFLDEIYRKDRQELHVAARPILNPGEIGEGCIYFDNEIGQVACWGFDDLIDFSGPPPHLLEEAEGIFRKWLSKMTAQSGTEDPIGLPSAKH